MHPAAFPDVPRLLEVLEVHRIVYVITGSVAALIYGVELEPGDLDIVPSPGRANLVRLAEVLNRIEARPPGPFGDWEVQPDGEEKWVARPTTPEELAAWAPDPEDVSTFDHCLHTRFGNLDVVPRITGTYDDLKRRALRLPICGFRPWVAHIDDVIARLTIPRREKDVPRVAELRRIQRERGLASD